MGGRVVVLDHQPHAPLVDALQRIGLTTTSVAELDVSLLRALPLVDAVLVNSAHAQRGHLREALNAARVQAPIVVIRRSTRDPDDCLDVISEDPSREELRALHWLVVAEQQRRLARLAESEALDSTHLSELGRVVTQVAHEIRNPLTALSAKLQWLRRKAEGSDVVAKTSDSMLEEVHRLARMLSDMLEFGRSRTYSKRTSSEVSQTLNEVVALYRETCEQARVHLVLDPGSESGARVPFPAEELHQVFQNLLTNAIDATPPDETIKIVVRPERDGRLCVEFHNPGHLPDEIKKKAFELFFTTKPNGTGLGLPIVRRIVAGVSGEIEALNVGDHVVIRLLLPLVPAA